MSNERKPLIDLSYAKTPEAIATRHRALRRLGEATVVAVGVVGVGVGVAKWGPDIASAIKDAAGPTISEETQTQFAEQGDGLDALIKRYVDGIDEVDIRDVRDYVESDPANIGLLDGLQVGEPVVLPVEVEP